MVDDDKRYYMDYTGTGNSLNVGHPHSLQLLMDSLRYWVLEMHVDGFRFDLAATLAREFYEVNRLSAFFELVQQDPVVSQVKLIAEPWDIGPGGYQVGNFPPQWTEWNGKYRDTVRDFWRGEPATLGEFAARLTGSSDLYEHSGRRPVASINFVTAHDGFTLNDLVSYNEKHNEANGEDNRDGESHNRSWNCGVEGPTDDPAVVHLRNRQKRNFLTTLLLSQGVPMLLHGDELGRTQQGNNNTYCQDSELTWIDWETEDTALVEFTASVARLRRHHPTFRRRRFFDGRPGDRSAGGSVAGHRVADSVGRGDDPGGLGLRIRPVGRSVPQRQGHPLGQHSRTAGGRRLVRVAVQRARRAARIHPAAGRVRPLLASGDRHRRTARATRADQGRGPGHRRRQEPSWCCAPSPPRRRRRRRASRPRPRSRRFRRRRRPSSSAVHVSTPTEAEAEADARSEAATEQELGGAEDADHAEAAHPQQAQDRTRSEQRTVTHRKLPGPPTACR